VTSATRRSSYRLAPADVPACLVCVKQPQLKPTSALNTWQAVLLEYSRKSPIRGWAWGCLGGLQGTQADAVLTSLVLALHNKTTTL
jgi:hypothetical protein